MISTLKTLAVSVVLMSVCAIGYSAPQTGLGISPDIAGLKARTITPKNGDMVCAGTACFKWASASACTVDDAFCVNQTNQATGRWELSNSDYGIYQVDQFFSAIGNSVISGLDVNGSLTNLTLNTTAGVVTSILNKKTSTYSYTGGTGITFQMYTQSGASGGPVTAVPVTQYDNAGVLTTLPANNDASIFRIFVNKYASNSYAILYGQRWYDTFALASAAIQSDTVVLPAALDDYILRGVIVVTRNAANFSSATNSRISKASIFGDLAQATGSASPTFTGATNTVDGGAGLVPAPAAGLQNQVLSGGGSFVNNIQLWVSGQIYQQGAVVRSVSNPNSIFRRTAAAGSGTTDPAADAANYSTIEPYNPGRPAFSAGGGVSNLSVNTNTNTNANALFTVEQFDQANNLSGGVFTAPTTGLYSFSARTRFDTNPAPSFNNEAFLEILVNGSGQLRGACALSGAVGGGASYWYCSVSGILSITSGQTVNVMIRQDSGSTLVAHGAVSAITNFQGYYLGGRY